MAPPSLPDGQKSVCHKHNLVFSNHKQLHLHKLQSRDHITCPICSLDFHTQEGYKAHHDQTHPAEQILPCPGGCSKVFARVGALIHHIEMNECSATQSYQHRREKVNNEVGQFERIRQTAAAMEPGAELYNLPPPAWTPPSATTASYVSRAASIRSVERQAPSGRNTPSLRAESPLIFFTPEAFTRQSVATPASLVPEIELSELQEIEEVENLMASHVLNTSWGEKVSTEPEMTKPMTSSAVKLTTFAEAAYGTDFPPLGFGPKSLANTLKGSPASHDSPAYRVNPSDIDDQNTLPTGKSPQPLSANLFPTSTSTAKRQAEFSPPSIVLPAWDFPTAQETTVDTSQPTSAWTTPKDLFPEAPAAILPSASLLKSVTSSSKPTVDPSSNEFSIYDPSSPAFKSSRFYLNVLHKFKCPHKGCKKSFDRESAFIQHLRSPAHLAESLRLKCPRCLRYYDTATALTQHAESQGLRCDIRNHNEFGAYVNDITANTAAVDGVHIDNTVKYVVNDLTPLPVILSATNAERVAVANAKFIQKDNDAIEMYWNVHKPKW